MTLKSAAVVVTLYAFPSLAADEGLSHRLAELVRQPALKNARVAIQVETAQGELVFSQGGDERLNPASNVKLFTAAAALDQLGAGYQFETEFHVLPSRGRRGGKVLFVRGKGDPTISTERLFGMARALRRAGVRDIREIVVDDSWFDGVPTPVGYDQEKTDRAYAAPTSALSLNLNVVGIHFRPGPRPGARASVEVEPATAHFLVNGKVRTARYGAPDVRMSVDGNHQRIDVGGTVSMDPAGRWLWKKVDQPAIYFGETLKRMLQLTGVKVTGQVRRGLTPKRAMLVHVDESDPLDVILKRVNKNSSNFVAEQLLKAMSAVAQGAPGTFEGGIEVVAAFLERVGIPRGSYVMRNGSGLNDANRFSPKQIVTLLRYMAERHPAAPEYFASLGIAGKDGTLRHRFGGSDAVGQVRGKTGTLDRVTALSGLVRVPDADDYIFSVLVNDIDSTHTDAVRAVDALVGALARAEREDGDRQLALSAPKLERAKLYLRLGQTGRTADAPFLHTALQHEEEALVRAVILHSLFRVADADSLPRELLTRTLRVDDGTCLLLRDFAREAGVDFPALEPLAQLAEAGDAAALSHLILMSFSVSGLASAEERISEAFGNLASRDPALLIRTLQQTPVASRQVAVKLLMDALVTSASRGEHPMRLALRRAAELPALAPFAQELEGNLSTRVAGR